MKIENDLLTGLIRDPQELKKTDAPRNSAADFAAALEQTLDAENTASPVLPGISNKAVLGGLSAFAPVQPAFASAEGAEQAADEVADLLDMMDSYSSVLSGKGEAGQENLKAAYKVLETISNNAAGLRSSLTGLADSPALASIINEIEVMAATEKFKLNRGDYLG